MARKFTIGREKGCDVLIGDESVSRVHAEIWLGDDGKIMIADRGSSNGTMLVRDGIPKLLSHGSVERSDTVRLGTVAIDVKDLIEAIEVRNPGAFSVPPPLPPPPPAAFSAPVQAGPPPPPPPLPPPPRAGPQLIRCACGAIKTVGQPCPACLR
jgi:hypothetical protein